MAIRGQQTTLLTDIDVAPQKWRGLDHMTGKCFISGIEEHLE